MKKKQKKLSLEKFNIARLTKNMQFIYGGSGNAQNNTQQNSAHSNECQTYTSDTDPPQSDSSLECGLISGACNTHQGLGTN